MFIDGGIFLLLPNQCQHFLPILQKLKALLLVSLILIYIIAIVKAKEKRNRNVSYQLNCPLHSEITDAAELVTEEGLNWCRTTAVCEFRYFMFIPVVLTLSIKI